MTKRKCGQCRKDGHDARNCPDITGRALRAQPDHSILRGLTETLNAAMGGIESLNAYELPTMNVDKDGGLFIEETPSIQGAMAIGVCQFYIAKVAGRPE